MTLPSNFRRLINGIYIGVFFDFFIELIAYGGQEAIENKRFPRPVRLILIILYLILFIAVTGFILLAGILVVRDNLIFGILILGIAVIFVLGIIKEIKKAYAKKKNVE